MKKYSIELNQADSKKLKGFLQDNKIKYYSQGCYNNIYFSLELSKNQVEIINNFLDTI